MSRSAHLSLVSTSAQTLLKPRFQPLAGNAPDWAAVLSKKAKPSLLGGIKSYTLLTRQSLKALSRLVFTLS